jgi:hypothetical protein
MRHLAVREKKKKKRKDSWENEGVPPCRLSLYPAVEKQK